MDSQMVICPRCNGSGLITLSDASQSVCKLCRGRGIVSENDISSVTVED